MTYKRIILSFIITCLYFSVNKATEAYKWTSHICYSLDITQLAKQGDIVYALTDNKLFSYNTKDSSVETYINNKGGNSDINQMIYSSKHKCLLLIRSDANIELLYDDKSSKSIPYLKTVTQNIDKTVNQIFIDGDYAYLATNFGYLILNLKDATIAESTIFNLPFYSITPLGDQFLAATANGVLSIDKSANWQDFSNWKQYPLSPLYNNSEYAFEDKEIRKLVIFEDKLIFLIPQKATYILKNSNTVDKLLAGNNPQSLSIEDNKHLFISNDNTLWDYSTLDEISKTNIENLGCIIPNGNSNTEYWMFSVGNNLSLIKRDNLGNYDFIERRIAPSGPNTNYPFSLTFRDKQLIVAGGGFYKERENRAGSISILKDARWTNIYPSDISAASGVNAMDISYAVSDPANPNHIFASSWGEGVYEFENAKFKNRYDQTNSTIQQLEITNSDGSKWITTRTGGMVYDKNSNLWILNSQVPNILKIYQKNGIWGEINYPEIGYPEIDTNVKNITIDRYSNKWVSSVGSNPFIFIFNENGTIANTNDDKKKLTTNFRDQNDNILTITDIDAVTPDNTGNMWIGTDIGPFVVRNTTNPLSNTNDLVFNQVMVTKSEDNNTIIALLDDVPVSAIAVDGANRKWLATKTAGVYLLDSDNKTILEHFTIDNSPLPSNNILSLAIDPETGVVYIGSERGLVSYRGGATEATDSFSDVYAYPNPVRPDYAGEISITGLKSNSLVKITDVRGNLINEGKSLGGQYNWNGLNRKGQRVDTGVYLVFGSSEDGLEGVVTKIMVIN